MVEYSSCLRVWNVKVRFEKNFKNKTHIGKKILVYLNVQNLL